ncbi:MAG: Asp-tRNA(Asn)/Glu-tRNA(Gln) amidotransferase subunit GatC [bacterium]
MEIKDIEKLAELSKIELTDKEKEGLLKDLDSILGYVKQITEVDVKDTEVVYENRNVWREDEIDPSPDFSHDLIISQFPDSQDGFIKVKKIM